MKLSLVERETILLYNQAEPMAEIYTHDPRLMEKTAVHGVSPEAATTGGLYTASSTYDTGFSPYPPTRKVLFTAKLTF